MVEGWGAVPAGRGVEAAPRSALVPALPASAALPGCPAAACRAGGWRGPGPGGGRWTPGHLAAEVGAPHAVPPGLVSRLPRPWNPHVRTPTAHCHHGFSKPAFEDRERQAQLGAVSRAVGHVREAPFPAGRARRRPLRVWLERCCAGCGARGSPAAAALPPRTHGSASRLPSAVTLTFASLRPVTVSSGGFAGDSVYRQLGASG